jgi:hypothetical protein
LPLVVVRDADETTMRRTPTLRGNGRTGLLAVAAVSVSASRKRAVAAP